RRFEEIKRSIIPQKKSAAQGLQTAPSICYPCVEINRPQGSNAAYFPPKLRRTRHESEATTQVSWHSPSQSSAKRLGTMVSRRSIRSRASRFYATATGASKYPRNLISKTPKE